MTTTLDDYLNKRVQVITGDGRDIFGMLLGFDQTTNLIIEDARERIFSSAKKLEIAQLGLQLIKGSNVALVGLIDAEVHDNIDWEQMSVRPMEAIWEAD
uniref:U6 snRNA-associated Sm-like protein LSm8 n=1 Tax=Rhabditophanes sp. KR3021 TaxID=114890 RepID=A0AC35U157_9BILA